MSLKSDPGIESEFDMASLVVKLCLLTATLVTHGLPAQMKEAPVHMDRTTLAQYTGAYQWDADHFLYVQFWDELGKDQLGAFDESGMVRSLYPLGSDNFFVGAGIVSPIASRSPHSLRTRQVWAS